MQSILNFFLWSSVNPEKVSLTVKAGLPFIITVLAMFNLHTDISPLIDSAVLAFNTFAMFVSAAFTLYGLVRKFYYTLYS